MDYTKYLKWFEQIDESDYREFLFTLKETPTSEQSEIVAHELDILEKWCSEIDLTVEVSWIFHSRERIVRNRVVIFPRKVEISHDDREPGFRPPMSARRRPNRPNFELTVTKGEDDYFWAENRITDDVLYFKCDDIGGVIKLLSVITSNQP